MTVSFFYGNSHFSFLISHFQRLSHFSFSTSFSFFLICINEKKEIMKNVERVKEGEWNE